MSEYLQT